MSGFASPPTRQDSAAMTAQATSAASDPGAPPHGYALEEVDRLARRAARLPMAGLLDPDDAYEACWGAVIEHLYTAPAPPPPGHLFMRARDALQTAVADTRRHPGVVVEHRGLTRVNFDRYWAWHRLPVPSPEALTVERAALGQIWTMLSPCDREARVALASAGTYQDAARVLRLTQRAFNQRIARARTRFLKLWHEHETPSRPWRRDIRAREVFRQAAQRRGHGPPCPCYRCRPDLIAFGHRRKPAPARAVVA